MERKNVCFVMFTLTKHCQCRLHAGFSPLCLTFVLQFHICQSVAFIQLFLFEGR